MSEDQDVPTEARPESSDPEPADDETPFELPPLDLQTRSLDRLGPETRDGD